jgi:hypothetical protein
MFIDATFIPEMLHGIWVVIFSLYYLLLLGGILLPRLFFGLVHPYDRIPVGGDFNAHTEAAHHDKSSVTRLDRSGSLVINDIILILSKINHRQRPTLRRRV